MTLDLIRTSPYNNNKNFGFALFNNSLYYCVPDGKWVYRYPLIYFNWIYVKTFNYVPKGITYDGKFFYVIDQNYYTANKYDHSFTLIKAYPLVIFTTTPPVFILSVNGFFYVGYYMNPAFDYFIVKYNFKFIRIKTIHPGTPNPNSIAYDGKFFYLSFDLNQTICKYDSDFKFVSTSSSLGYQPTGLGWDGKFLYIWDTTNKFLKKYSVI